MTKSYQSCFFQNYVFFLFYKKDLKKIYFCTSTKENYLEINFNDRNLPDENLVRGYVECFYLIFEILPIPFSSSLSFSTKVLPSAPWSLS